MTIEEQIKQARQNGIKHLQARITYLETLGFDVVKMGKMKQRVKEMDKLIKDTYATDIGT